MDATSQGVAVIITLALSVFAPLLTVSRTTYLPATSGTNCAIELVELTSLVLDPVGMDISVHLKDNVPPAGFVEPVPFSMTGVPTFTICGGPGFALGGGGNVRNDHCNFVTSSGTLGSLRIVKVFLLVVSLFAGTG